MTLDTPIGDPPQQADRMGVDEYVYHPGDGHDRIVDAGENRLRFPAGVDREDLLVTRTGEADTADYVLLLGHSPGDSVTVVSAAAEGLGIVFRSGNSPIRLLSLPQRQLSDIVAGGAY